MINELETNIDHRFCNPKLLDEALTHPSSNKQHPDKTPYSYERLEFLGDAILGLVIAELLLKRYPHEPEGALAKRQAALVKGESLVKVATHINLGQYLIMTDGEVAGGGRKNPSNLEDAMEALIGAIYQDGGLDAARNCIHKQWKELIETMQEPPRDPKTALQEWAQGNGLPVPEYCVTQTSGPPHAPQFTIEVRLPEHQSVSATGESKKKAEKKAAMEMLKSLGLG